MEAKSLSVKQHNAIDLAKLICALFVVAIHVSPFGSTDQMTILSWMDFFLRNCIARIAVPFFFITSGYFLFRKTDINNFDFSPCKAYLKKLIKLYLIWSAIYFPLGFGNALIDGKDLLHGILNYVKNFIFSTSYSHLWYLNALIFATAVISFLLYKRVKPAHIIFIGGLFYFIGLFGQSWFGFLDPLRTTFIWDILKSIKSVISTTRDGLFDALIFVAIGMLFAYNDIRLTKNRAGIGLTISLLLLFAESFTLQYFGISRFHDTYLFIVPCALFLFAFVNNIELPDHKKYKSMRVYSSLIYFIHPWVLRAIAVVNYIIFKKSEIFLLNYLLTLLITFLISRLILKSSAKPKGKWLNNLYS